MLCVTGVCLREIINFFFVSRVSGLVENCNIGIYSGTINVININLHNGTTHSALPVHTAFSDFDHISRSQHDEQFLMKILCSYPVKLICRIVK